MLPRSVVLDRCIAGCCCYCFFSFISSSSSYVFSSPSRLACPSVSIQRIYRLSIWCFAKQNEFDGRAPTLSLMHAFTYKIETLIFIAHHRQSVYLMDWIDGFNNNSHHKKTTTTTRLSVNKWLIKTINGWTSCVGEFEKELQRSRDNFYYLFWSVLSSWFCKNIKTISDRILESV